MAKAPKGSVVIDTRVIYCGDTLDQLRKLPEAYVDLIYIDPPFSSNRNYEVVWGETAFLYGLQSCTGRERGKQRLPQDVNRITCDNAELQA